MVENSIRWQVDLAPSQRDEQISIARRVLNEHRAEEFGGNADDDALRRACEVILSLSDTPTDRKLADTVLRALEARASDQV